MSQHCKSNWRGKSQRLIVRTICLAFSGPGGSGSLSGESADSFLSKTLGRGTHFSISCIYVAIHTAAIQRVAAAVVVQTYLVFRCGASDVPLLHMLSVFSLQSVRQNSGRIAVVFFCPHEGELRLGHTVAPGLMLL